MSHMVLVIYDNEMNRELLSTMLERLGLACLTREDGRSGLGALEEHVYSLVMVDLKLPDMDGVDVVSAIRAHARNGATKVLLISGSQVADGQGSALCRQCDGYLAKPFTFDQLSDAVKAQLGEDFTSG